ncbi:MAG: helix-turn-helix domain-containing protein [Rectinemataceae bacterium]
MVPLYDFFRGTIGCSLVVGGLAFLIAPGRNRVSRRLGLLFAAAGFLFCFSALDLVGRIPEPLSTFLVLAAILALSQALLEITLYLFSEDRREGLVRLALGVGIAWSILLWSVPFLDYLIGWSPTGRSIEGGLSRGPLHTAVSIAVYVWPMAMAVVATMVCHRSFRYLPTHAPGTKVLLYSTLFLVIVLCVILAGVALSSPVLYCGGQAALETLTLSSYLFVVVRPELFSLARSEIHDTREKRLRLSDEEAQVIIERIMRVAATPSVLCRTGFNLRALAVIAKVPPYRLSICFNTRLKTSFPAWLNALRIEYARRQILEHPERSILEVLIDAGYSSRSVFNKQFSRIVGVPPGEYRRSAAGTSRPGPT